MFKKSKIKIVVSIMFIMVFLIVGTLCIIYLTSYMEVYQKNQEMLERYIDAYSENGNPDDIENNDGPVQEDEMPEPSSTDRAFQLSTFYSVAFSNNEVTSIDNNDGILYSDEQLAGFASSIIDKEKIDGTYGNLIYRVASEKEYTLVAFMDNTIVEESTTALFKYTLLFGGCAFIVIFFLAFFLSKQIVKPLEQAYHKQKQFISDAGHELKTPVSAVSTNVEMLSREIGENQWLSNILFENNRMAAVIRQLLDLAQMENVVPSMAQIDFSRIVMGEILSFEIIAFEKELQLSYDSVAEDVMVYGNGEQLRQLTSILLDNAIRHSFKHGTVTVSLMVKHNKACLSVSNEGKEIPEDQRELIFERFYRADFSRTGGENHYGLGLAIAKSIVSSHHGNIFVSCGQGHVTFSVSVPIRHA